MGLYHLLRDLLQGKERRCFFVPCHRHNSELAFSQGLSHLKVFKWQFWGLFLVVFEIDKLGRWRPGVRVVGRGRRSNIFKSFLVGGLGIFGSVTLKGLICVGLLAKNISFRQSFIIVVARGKFLGHVYFGLCFLFDPRWWKFFKFLQLFKQFFTIVIIHWWFETASLPLLPKLLDALIAAVIIYWPHALGPRNVVWPTSVGKVIIGRLLLKYVSQRLSVAYSYTFGDGLLHLGAEIRLTI